MEFQLATFVSFITNLLGRELASSEINRIKAFLEDGKLSPDKQKQTLITLLSAFGADRKIEAIKEFRVATGCGLLEAKNAIEEAYRNRDGYRF